jgi:hypothetical protein
MRWAWSLACELFVLCSLEEFRQCGVRCQECIPRIEGESHVDRRDF